MEYLTKYPAELLILLFLLVTFLQSGIDKAKDWEGNNSFLKDHFKNTPFKNLVPVLSGIIMVMEIIAGAMMLVGTIQLATTGLKNLALQGIELAAITLLFLLIGQRIAKDYAGAMTIAVYFIITVFGIYLLSN